MKKVLIMNDLVVGGGVEKVMWEIIDMLQKSNYEVTLLTPQKERLPYKKNIRYVFFIENKSAFYKLRKFLNILALFYRISKTEYDYVVAMKEGRCMKYVRWMKASKKLAWVHIDYDQLYYTKSKFKFIKEINYMEKFDHIFCVSHQVKKSIIHKVGDPGNLQVLYNPINIREIIQKSQEKIDDFQRDNSKFLFISVGRLSHEKGIDRLIEACGRLAYLSDKFDLLVIGDGPERAAIERAIKEYQLNNIILIGQRDNPYKYIKNADCFISASRTESFGLSIYEALVCGKKCIITNCPGSCEIFDSKKNGWIVRNSIDGICEGIKYVMEENPVTENSDIKKIEEKCNIRNIYEFFGKNS